MSVGVFREQCWCHQLLSDDRKDVCLRSHPLWCLQRSLSTDAESSFAVGLSDEDMHFVMDVWEQEMRREVREREDPLGVETEVEIDVAVQRWRECNNRRRAGYLKAWWIHRKRRRDCRKVQKGVVVIKKDLLSKKVIPLV